MTGDVFVKRYTTPQQAAAAHAHHEWQAQIATSVRIPTILDSGPQHLVFEYIVGRQPTIDDLATVSQALGEVHAVAHSTQLHAAQLDEPFTAPNGLTIPSFVTSRRHTLDRLNVSVPRRPAAFYKDANIRNFLLTDSGVAMVDFDDLTLAPVGYDLAKLVVSAAMTYGHINRRAIDKVLNAYNTHAVTASDKLECSLGQFKTYTEIHHQLTAPYLNRNGYRHRWPTVRPWTSS